MSPALLGFAGGTEQHLVRRVAQGSLCMSATGCDTRGWVPDASPLSRAPASGGVAGPLRGSPARDDDDDVLRARDLQHVQQATSGGALSIVVGVLHAHRRRTFRLGLA